VASRRSERETRGDRLRNGRDRLQGAGIESPDLEAELLMREALRAPGGPPRTKAWLLPRLGDRLTDDVQDRFEALLARRLAHEPTAYILGTREFNALDFEVTPDVLIPRPETEGLVGAAMRWHSGASGHFTSYPTPPETQFFLTNGRKKTDPLTVVDVGTGSGAIAVALAKRLPGATVIATDVSWPALAVARRNAERHDVERRISFRHGDLLLPLDTYVDLIVANLPYVSDADWPTLDPEVRDHEPRLALTAGDDGLELIGSLLHQAPRYLRPNGAIVLEFGFGQAEAIARLAAGALPGATLQLIDDLAGIPRVLVAALGTA
jgi:release factor glutamine methyltransferase